MSGQYIAGREADATSGRQYRREK